nr:protein FAR1-RELATED SEQUENCE 5-like [Ipomoea trifida]
MEAHGLSEHRWLQLMFELRAFGGCTNYHASLTPLAIERYAAVFYTITIFYDVQAEIVASCFECCVLFSRVDGDVKRVEVEGANGVMCVVVFHMAETTASCSCRMFERVGLLCRHIFLVLKDARVESIPACYIVSWWTRDEYKRLIYDIDGVHDASALRGNSSKGAMKEV